MKKRPLMSFVSMTIHESYLPNGRHDKAADTMAILVATEAGSTRVVPLTEGQVLGLIARCSELLRTWAERRRNLKTRPEDLLADKIRAAMNDPLAISPEQRLQAVRDAIEETQKR